MKPLFILVLSLPHLLLGFITLTALFDMPAVNAVANRLSVPQASAREAVTDPSPETPPVPVRLASLAIPPNTPALPEPAATREETTLPLETLAIQADFYDRGLWLKGGTDAFEAHIRGGWKTGWSEPVTEKDGASYHTTTEKHAIMDVHLPWQDTLRVRLRVRQTLGYTSVTLKLRGEDSVRLSCPTAPGWHVVEGELTPANKESYNSLYVQTPGVQVDWIHIYPASEASDDSPLPDRPPEFFEKRNENKALALTQGRKTVWWLEPTEKSFLRWTPTFEPGSTDKAEALSFSVRIAPMGGEETWILYTYDRKNAAKPFSHPEEIDLSGYANDLVRVELSVEGGDAKDRLWLENPRFGRYDPVRLDTMAWEPPRHVLVYISDTLRWDKVRSYDPDSRVKSDFFDETVRNGVIFKHAYVQGNSSKPSQATLLTGGYPQTLNMIRHGDVLNDRNYPTFPMMVKEHKPKVVATILSSNGYVSSRFGFGGGWNYNVNTIRESLCSDTENLIDILKNRWDSLNTDENGTINWMVTIDPHVPYKPPTDILARYDTLDYNGDINPNRTAWYLLDIKRKKVLPTPRDMRRLVALYDGEVDYNIEQYGHLLDYYRTRDMLDDTMIVITSDHGDEFLEHGSAGHGHSLYNELVRVPLIVSYPKCLPKGVEIEEATELAGLVPTLLEALDLPVPASVEGKSWLPRLQGHKEEPLNAQIAHSAFMSTMRMGASTRWKLIERSKRDPYLFDIATDKYEARDLQEKRKDVVYYLRKRMASWLREEK